MAPSLNPGGAWSAALFASRLFALLAIASLSVAPFLAAAEGDASEAGFVSLFDGRSLDGWEGDPDYWRVEDGNLVGEISPETIVKRNTFIIWQGGQPDDFELRLSYRITEDGNSGINYRSERMDDHPFALRGYQCDIDGRNRYTGQNYEERQRRTLAYPGQKVVIRTQPDPAKPGSLEANTANNAWKSVELVESLGDLDALKPHLKSGDWNEVRIVAKGNRLLHYVNDVLMSDVTDADEVNRSRSGFIGVQVHVGPPMKVEYRTIRLKPL